MSDTILVPPSLPTLVKPTVDTPFHIDYGWWERQNMQMSSEVRAHLCAEHKAVFEDTVDTATIDWVDQSTGEVSRVDGPQHVLRVHCSKQPEYINERLPLVASVFRVFLANGNKPLTSRELGSVLGRPPDRILATLSGVRTYKGIRPVWTAR